MIEKNMYIPNINCKRRNYFSLRSIIRECNIDTGNNASFKDLVFIGNLNCIGDAKYGLMRPA